MPLPTNGTPWPEHDRHSQAMAEWSAWYSGDPDQLSTFYNTTTPGVSTRPAQYRGGVVGKVARWWWGTPTPDGEQRTKLHVPLAADIAGTSADLLFSEPVQLTGDSEGLQEFLDDLQDGGLDSTLHEAGEVQAALGGVYLRTVWDDEVSELPWLDPVHPDGAQPEWRHGRLWAVNLWTTLAELRSGVVHRQCERHERGAIIYRLYEGTGTNLGRAVPLQDHPATAELAKLVDEDGIQETGTSRLTVAYVPNMLPNRLDRHNPQGRSDFQGVTPLFDALDEAYSSWWRDIRVGKARLHVPAQYLDDNGPGEAASVNLDRELYVPMQGVLAKSGDGMLIDAQQFAIRVTEHAETCKAWTERAIESAGYSTQSLSSGSGGAVTAAEVHAHERRSYMTRGKKVRYWTAALQDALETLVEVANANLGAGIRPGDLGVTFQDGVQESTSSLAQTVQALRNAESASTRTRVQMLHPEWDAEKVDAEVAAILGETGGAPLPDPEDAGL
jgi:A118 family predicted phage portal protein